MTREAVAFILRISIGVTFLMAASAKLRQTNDFVAAVARYPLVPRGYERTVAYFILASEFLPLLMFPWVIE